MNTNPQSKGIVTTEFWLVLVANIITTALASLEKIDTPWAVIAITILTGLYALLRAAIKNKILDQPTVRTAQPQAELNTEN